ncbi:glycosyltransferase [Microbacterium sp. Marseille-Q6965]|uniref:glycosyltransferase n=1 Tax=Microbacterium sp. Marseille-Q6965 TaxID=2965072 RepID=UPI0021B70EBA|nr:glycosyltransferase [Microbacterium sp. Marseille-Q6965]
MHIVMFADQHVETLGGAQVSTRLQRRYLERAGHTVSIVAPRRHGPRASVNAADPAYRDLPSIPVTLDLEYSFTWPGARSDAAVERVLASRPHADIVHVQADFWSAFLGYRYARRHGLPVVHTMHNRVDVGLRATTPCPGLLLRALNVWRRRAMPGSGPGSDGWDYLRGLARTAAAVTAPSHHFARRLERHGVAERVDAIWNGMDDELLERMRAEDAEARDGDVPHFVWIGRMSPEKRLLPFLRAVARAAVPMRVEVIGDGAQRRAARRLVRRYGLEETVRFLGGLPYEQTLARVRAADALVQTSLGFETQGMTPFEAAALGTPSVMSDPDIAAEVGSGVWHVGDPSRADPSVDALAEALRRAAADIRAGAAPVPDPAVGARFRQSASTAAMIEVYERVRSR